MDINQEIQKISDSIIAEKLPSMVESSVTKMLQSVIDELFSSYGPMSKKIKTTIEQKLDINLQQYDLIDYNALVAKTINDNLLQQVNLQPILDLTKNMLGFVELKTIKLSTIVEMFIEAAKDDSSDSEGAISLYVEKNDKHNWIEVSVDIRAEIRENECGIRFLVDTKNGNIFCFKCKDHWTNLNPVTPSKMIALSHLEHKIFRLYSAQVKIEIDNLDYDVEWSKYYD